MEREVVKAVRDTTLKNGEGGRYGGIEAGEGQVKGRTTSLPLCLTVSVCVLPGVFALLQAYAFLQYLKDRLTRQEFQTLFLLGVSLAAGLVFLTVIYLTYTGLTHTHTHTHTRLTHTHTTHTHTHTHTQVSHIHHTQTDLP